MFKRVRWMSMGAVAGVGASAWAQRRLRRTLQEHPSIQTGADLVSAARRVGQEVGAAIAEGRQAMADREAALRAELDARHGPTGPERSRRDDHPLAGDRRSGRPHRSDRPPALDRHGLRVVDATSGPPRLKNEHPG